MPSRFVIIGKRPDLDIDSVPMPGNQRIPYPRRAIIRWHADNPGIMPEASVKLLCKRYARMTADNGVDTQPVQTVPLQRIVCTGKDKGIDRIRTAMQHGEAAA